MIPTVLTLALIIKAPQPPRKEPAVAAAKVKAAPKAKAANKKQVYQHQIEVQQRAQAMLRQ